MSTTASLSSKGQIVIPKAVRAELQLVPGTRFDVRVDNGRLVLAPIRAPEFDLEAIRRALDKVAGCLYRADRTMSSAAEDEEAVKAMLAADDARICRGEK